MKWSHALAALSVASSPAFAQSPSWTGRDIAATALPLTTSDPSVRTSREPSGRVVRGRDIGIRTPRTIYVDPYGSVTTYSGAPPYWMRGWSYDVVPSTPYWREEARRQAPAPAPQVRSPCVYSGGPATAASAIAQAASASGQGC